MTFFNQMVQQQTDFFVLHALELAKLDDVADLADLDPGRLRPFALAARRFSARIHSVIGDATWYHALKDSINGNIAELEGLLDVAQ